MKRIFYLAVFLSGLAALPVIAQVAVPPPTPEYQPLSPEQLDQLLAPIALYPDPLMAQILPASTLPTEIVLADRYVSGGGDPNQIEAQPWDPSVQAVAHYPNVLQWMDDNLDWTADVGQAFLNQQQDVMDSIQRLRTEAFNVGNLQSTPQQQVVNDSGDIEILPVDPQEVYLPSYQPGDVYYQGGFGLSFGPAFPIGIWLNCDFDWHHHHVIVWDHDHPRPGDWWHERPEQRNATIPTHTTVWHPVNRPGTGGANRGDRGWNNQPARSTGPAAPNRPEPRPHNAPGANRGAPQQAPVIHRPAPGPVQRPAAPAPAQHFESPNRPATSGALIGIQNSQATRNFSERGQQSVQTITHSAPAARPAPSFNGGGGGGGGGNRGGGGGGGGGRH